MGLSLLDQLQADAENLSNEISLKNGDWIVKGFIDVYKNIYAVPNDTKVVSKLLELFLIPKLVTFAEKNNYEAILANEQNYYPDMSFVSKETGEKFAIDIKSTYRINGNRINGMTLGAFTGYFRDRKSRKNIVFPYGDYKEHLVLGVVYSKCGRVGELEEGLVNICESTNEENHEITPSERVTYRLEDLEKIASIIKDIHFFVQPKFKIASAAPGSGNTKNIGSVKLLSELLSGNGPFAELGVEVFDDYWMNYLTSDMARNIESTKKFTNLDSYKKYRREYAQLPKSIEDD